MSRTAVRLRPDERALLHRLLRGPLSGLPVADLPGVLGWDDVRASETLAALQAKPGEPEEKGWVLIGRDTVRATDWAAVVCGFHRSRDGKRWTKVSYTRPHAPLPRDVAEGDDRRRKAGAGSGAGDGDDDDSGADDVPWPRELIMGCQTSWVEHPHRPPYAPCSACKGNPVRFGAVCVRCLRSGVDGRIRLARLKGDSEREKAERKRRKAAKRGLKGGTG